MNIDKTDHSPQISLILVTMNRKELLERCLRSVQRQTFLDMEIIVIDNASCDGTEDMVRNLFPDVRYYYLSTNLGPPGARNYGVQMSTAEICVFIDDDALFTDDDSLNRVFAYFSSDRRLGCLALRIVQPGDGCEEYKSIPRGDKKRIDADYECSYFCGAGFAIRRELFLKSGLFWEPLFYAGEELDLSYRLVHKGYKILRASNISVIHYETPQARVDGKWLYYGVRSRFWVAVRNLPWINVISHTFLWWGYYFIFAVRHRHPVYFVLGIKDAVLGFPEAVRSRVCISPKVIKKLKTLSGRVYY